jgi:hypothetical protein
MFNTLLYFFRPKYVVMHGVRIENRTIMFIGAHPQCKDGIVTFSNRGDAYYASNTHKVIWTHRELHKWRRLIGKDTRCLKREFFKWSRA